MILSDPKNHDEWIAERRKGIGASEAAAVLGLNPWQSNVDLWRIKTGKKLDEANEENTCLSDRIEELESRPVDVAVADNSHEIENMRKAMIKCDLEWSAKCDKLQEENFSESRKHMQEVSRIKSEYEQKIAEISKSEPTIVVDDKAIFKAYLSTAIDSAKRLLEFIRLQENSENYEFYCDKAQDFFKKIIQEVQND